MKNNKQERIRRRLWRLTAAALVLGLLTLATGYLGFLYQPPALPEEGLPAATQPTETTIPPTEATTQPTEATTQPTEATTQPTETTTQPTEAQPGEQEDSQTPEKGIYGEEIQEEEILNNPDQDLNRHPGGVYSEDAYSEDQYSEDEYSEGQYSEGQYSEDAYSEGQHSEDAYSEDGQTDNQDFGDQPGGIPGEQDAVTLTEPTRDDTVQDPEIQVVPTESTLPPEDGPQNIVAPASPRPAPEPGISPFQMAMRISCCILLAAELLVLLLLITLRRNVRQYAGKGKRRFPITQVSPISPTWRRREQPLHPIPGLSLGKLHDIGRRDYQQDSFGHTPVLGDTGLLAVLADGMGGLSGGERVSQKIVMEALNYGVAMTSRQLPNALPELVAGVNTAVNQMLGPQGLYSSGSTLVAALIARQQLWWVSVGDSRVYLYREGQINQLSRDHDLLQEWMGQILEGRRSMAEAQNDPEGRKLTSFIGMGELRYVDRCRTPIPLLPGDRVLLMSDGIYGTVTDEELQAILAEETNVQEAASRIGQRIQAVAAPYQDNYTLVILGYDAPEGPESGEDRV